VVNRVGVITERGVETAGRDGDRHDDFLAARFADVRRL